MSAKRELRSSRKAPRGSPNARSFFLSGENAHFTCKNAHHPLFIGVRCTLTVKKWVNSSKCNRGYSLLLCACGFCFALYLTTWRCSVLVCLPVCGFVSGNRAANPTRKPSPTRKQAFYNCSAGTVPDIFSNSSCASRYPCSAAFQSHLTASVLSAATPSPFK